MHRGPAYRSSALAPSARRLSASRPLLLVALAILILPAAFATDGVVEYVEGEVVIVSGGEERVADFGDRVFGSDRVMTGPDGTAIIRLDDQSQVKLRESTSVVIADTDGAREVELQSGGVFARVVRAASTVGGRDTFRIRTPSVVAGVRGTEFFVAYGRTVEEEPDLWLCVNEGSVEVSIPSTGQVTLVEEGLGINILGGTRATDPQFYSWTTELNWNFDPATGEISDDTDLDGAYSDLLDQDYD